MLNNVNVGDKFYRVTEKNLAFNRKKIYREIDGQDWFRYETPLREYSISTYTILGILTSNIQGEWPEDEPWALETEYYVQTDDNNAFTTYIDQYQFFSNYEAAVSHMKELEQHAKELDMT